MLDFISNETDKSIENANDGNKYVDLKTNFTWGNYNNTTLTNCGGKYCIINSNGSMVSNWEDNTEKTNSHSGYTILTTGSTEEVKKKNLYDVSGNLYECVQETTVVFGSVYTSYRGGSFRSHRPVCSRDSGRFSNTAIDNGFRPILYIK